MVYNSVAFFIFTKLYNHHHYLTLEHIYHSKRNSIPLAVTPHFPLAPALATTSLLSFSNFSVIGVQLIYNVVLVSVVWRSDSVIHTYIFILFQILFSYRFSQNTEQSSLCYTIAVIQLLVICLIYIVVCAYSSQALDLPSP